MFLKFEHRPPSPPHLTLKHPRYPTPQLHLKAPDRTPYQQRLWSRMFSTILLHFEIYILDTLVYWIRSPDICCLDMMSWLDWSLKNSTHQVYCTQSMVWSLFVWVIKLEDDDLSDNSFLILSSNVTMKISLWSQTGEILSKDWIFSILNVFYPGWFFCGRLKSCWDKVCS